MQNQHWTQINIKFKNKENPSVIEAVTSILFSFNSIGTELVDPSGDYTDQNDLFGELRDEPSLVEKNTPPTIIAFFDQTPSLDDLVSKIKSQLPQVDFTIEQDVVWDQNWNENWMDYYQIERLSRFLVVVPEWIDYQPSQEEKIIRLNPGLSFGTGNHPTTQLGSQALEIYMEGGEVVFDVGCGSGILSFVAASLGASQVNGYDLDPQAVSSARSNLDLQTDLQVVKLKETGLITFSVNDLLKGIDQKADIIVANILPHILVDMLEDASRLLNEDGYLILGGILEEKGPEIESAISKYNWKIIQKTLLGEWLGYVLEKEKDN